jgi:hypothetical protein
VNDFRYILDLNLILLPVQKTTAVGIFAITQEREELESCGFHHSKGYTAGHNNMLNLIGSAADQSGEFLINILNKKILETFLHSISSFQMAS